MVKTIIIAILLVGFTEGVSAQSGSTLSNPETPAIFPGGEDSLLCFIDKR